MAQARPPASPRGGAAVLALALSAGLHALPWGGPRIADWLGPAALGPVQAEGAAGAPAPAFRSQQQLDEARRELVRRALADREGGRLALGRFVLDADALDAEEARVGLDSSEARRRYEARCLTYREAAQGGTVLDAVETAFGDIAYSIAVTRLSDLLLAGVGACGPSAQLLASCLYDSGHRDGLALRYWGGLGATGTAHVTATWSDGRRTLDLTEGGPVQRGGASMPADQLVEAYARAHGLLPPLEGPVARDDATPDADVTASERFAYPPNSDVFESGSVPLFAEARRRTSPRPASSSAPTTNVRPQGALSAGSPGSPTDLDDELWQDFSWPLLYAGGDADDEVRCPLDPRALAASTATLLRDADSTRVELVPVLGPRSLGYAASVLDWYERRAPRQTGVERLVLEACLVLGYRWAGVRFAAAGYVAVSRESFLRAERHLRRAKSEHEVVLGSTPGDLPQALLEEPDHWVLIAFEDGANTLLEIELAIAHGGDDTSLTRPHWSRDRRTRALLSSASTAARLFERAASYPFEERIHLIGILATAQLSGLDSELELPESGFIPASLAAYDRLLAVMREPEVDPDLYYERWAEVMNAAGATPADLAKLEKEMERARQIMRKRKPRL